MKYFLKLLPRPFEAIKNSTKKIEGRPSKTIDDRYAQMKAGDEIVFTNSKTGSTLDTTITFIHHHKTVRDMLEKEGVENVLSSGGTIEEGIESYYNLGDYKERIKKFGIYAIGIEIKKAP